MAATSWNAKQPYVRPKNGVPRIVYGLGEAASQSYKAGTPVYLNSGAVTICADDTEAFTGIAMKDATGTTGTEAPVMICDLEDTIVARVVNDGTAALANTLTPGTGYGWYEDTDDVFYADSNDTSNTVLVFLEEVNDAAGASTYWGLFRVKQGITGNLDIASE